MKLVLMHVDNPGFIYRSAFEEEASFIIPGGERTALLVPFAALENTISIIADALGELPEQHCGACGNPLAVVPQWGDAAGPPSMM